MTVNETASGSIKRSGWSTIEVLEPLDQGPIRQVTFAEDVEIFPDNPMSGGPLMLYGAGDWSVHTVNLQSYEDVSPGVFTAIGQQGTRLLVRGIDESDTMKTPLYSRSLALPIPAIIAMLEGGPVPDTLEALCDDNGNVVTMFLASSAGLFVRFSKIWHVVPQPEDFSGDYPLDGLNVVEVADDALAVFDQADINGQMVSVANLPLAPGEDISWFSDRIVEQANAARQPSPDQSEEIAASMVAAGISPIRSAADVPAAVEAATAEPSMRWYVERRARALGVEIDFPWSDHA